jgi:SAM-dependent methyltransferase
MIVAPALPDFSEYLSASPDRIAREESGWAAARHYQRNARQVMAAAALFGLGSGDGYFKVLELGCGSGWVPSVLPATLNYTGVDNNARLVELARARNISERAFIVADIRTVIPPPPTADLVCSFAVLKHFGLHEWERIFMSMLALGRVGVFNIQLAPSGTSAYDDGTQFHHTWVTETMVEECVRSMGDRVYRSEVMHSDATLGDDCVYYVGPRT